MMPTLEAKYITCKILKCLILCWGRISFHRRQKNFDFIDFWLPYWSCLCHCQNKPAGDPRGPCGRPEARGPHVGDPWFRV